MSKKNISISDLLKQLKLKINTYTSTYYIPELWMGKYPIERMISKDKEKGINVDPYDFYSFQLQYIVNHKNDHVNYSKSLSQMYISEQYTKEEWFRKATLYGILVRSFTAWDHDGNGILGSNNDNNINNDITLNSSGIRETGTFLKTISMLQYLMMLGINTLYMLPIASIGKANKKGELGCPYSIRNIFKIEETLADPLTGLTAEEEFKILCESCHILGMRVMIDFPLRTTSRDSVWIKEHPDWYYWLNKKDSENFTSPQFSEDELNKIFDQVNSKTIRRYIPPHQDYIDKFSIHPEPEDVTYINDNEGYIGKINEQELVIPGGFADWPPNDIQPPWSDVTYLKLYIDDNFNYIAYNTIRMYDDRIKQKNESLWDMLQSVIPYYQKNYGLDGVRIDMGHAFPDELEKGIIKNAKMVDSSFVLISEDFNIKSDCYKDGYDGVWGNSWYMEPRIVYIDGNGKKENYFKKLVLDLSTNVIPAIVSCENPDTPRALSRKDGDKLAQISAFLNCFIYNGTTFINSGFEFGEENPANLGLDFTYDYIKNYNGKLSFFDKTYLSWSKERSNIERIRNCITLRYKYHDILLENQIVFNILDVYECKNDSSKDDILAYSLLSQRTNKRILIVQNFSFENNYEIVFNLSNIIDKDVTIYDELNQTSYHTQNLKLELKLKCIESYCLSI